MRSGRLRQALAHLIVFMSNNHGDRRGGSHARIYASWRHLPAWTTLSAPAIKLLTYLMCEYRPGCGNIWRMDDAMAALILNCSLPTAGRAVRELVHKGWLRSERAGGLSGPRGARSRHVSLSLYPTAARPAEQWRFQHWQKKDESDAGASGI